MMLRMFALYGLALGLGIMLVFTNMIRGPLERLARFVLSVTAFVIGVGGLAIAASGLAEEAWWAVIIGAAMLLVALRIGWSLRRRKPRGPSMALPPAAPMTVTVPAAGSAARWAEFERRLDWVGRKQARRAQRSIDLLLAERDSPSLDVEQRSLLLACEKRVPELIETCLDRCRNATGRECDLYTDRTLQTLIDLGEEAQRARSDIRAADDRRLETLHRYFDGAVEKTRDDRLR